MNHSDIRLLVLDVDGVLTDGRLEWGGAGEPQKSFCVQDGFAIQLWRRSGAAAALLSGRSETSVARRAAELGIELVVTGASDKLRGYEIILARSGCDDAHTAFVGDDFPDLAVMKRCALPIAVANAVATVKRSAHYVSRRCGGEGAVAEVIEWLLRRAGRWSSALREGI